MKVISKKRPKRVIKKLEWLIKDMVVTYALLFIDDDIPNAFSEVIHSSENGE